MATALDTNSVELSQGIPNLDEFMEKLKHAAKYNSDNTVDTTLELLLESPTVGPFLNKFFNKTMCQLRELLNFDFSAGFTKIIVNNDLLPEVKVNENYKKLVDFLNISGEYYTTSLSLYDYITRCVDMYNKVIASQPDAITIPNNGKLGAIIKSRIDGFLGKHLTDKAVKNLIPSENFSVEYINADDTYVKSSDHIIIVPGASNPSQCAERVARLLELIPTSLDITKVKYIIFSGRGNDFGLNDEYRIDLSGMPRKVIKNGVETYQHVEKSSRRFVTKKGEPIIESSKLTQPSNIIIGPHIDTLEHKDNLSYEAIPTDTPEFLAMMNSIKTSDLVRRESTSKPHNYDINIEQQAFFETEAFYMAKLFYEGLLLKTDLSEDFVKTCVSKIRLESMALETTANFIFAPYSVAYSVVVKTNADTNTTSITAQYNPEMLNSDNISQIIEEMHTSNLHVISNDFHILRCVVICLHTLRPYELSSLKEFGNVYFYPCKTEQPLMGENYFSSFYQPNAQIFFSKDVKPSVGFAKCDAQGLLCGPLEISCGNESLHNTFLFRLLLDHGFYADLKLERTVEFLKRLKKLYRIFITALPATALPADLPADASPATANNQSGGNRKKTTRKNKKNKSQKKLHKSVKKLKKKNY
jgi:hypothetical protein